MLSFVKQSTYNVYSWSMRKLRSMALDFIALFNKEYSDRKRIEYIILEYTVKDPVQIELKPIEIKYDPPKLFEKIDINQYLVNDIKRTIALPQSEMYDRVCDMAKKYRIDYNSLLSHSEITAKDITVRKDQHSSTEIKKNIVAMFPSAERAVKDEDFMRAYNSGYNYQGNNDVLYELVTSLQTGRRNLTDVTEIVDNLIINYEKYDSNRDLVFLLKLVCKSSCYDVSIRKIIANYKINSRDAMIEEICSLQKEEMLRVNQEKLGYIVKMLPILEKKSYDSVVTAVRSEGLEKLEEILADHIHIAQEKIKPLTGTKGLVLNVKPVSTRECSTNCVKPIFNSTQFSIYRERKCRAGIWLMPNLI